MMSSSLPLITALVPHRDTMLLIDRLIEASDDHALGEVLIGEDSRFYRPGCGVPVYVGIEYMAQTVAAYDGVQRMKTGAPPAIGFLLGTRRFVSSKHYFQDQDHLTIRADKVFFDGGMASFDCTININGEPSITATLNVYRPDAESDMMTGMPA